MPDSEKKIANIDFKSMTPITIFKGMTLGSWGIFIGAIIGAGTFGFFIHDFFQNQNKALLKQDIEFQNFIMKQKDSMIKSKEIQIKKLIDSLNFGLNKTGGRAQPNNNSEQKGKENNIQIGDGNIKK
jgi:hypothetical protein